MIIYYIDSVIVDKSLKKLVGIDLFSNLLIGGSSLERTLRTNLPTGLNLIPITFDDIPLNTHGDDAIYWTSNVTFLKPAIQRLFLRKLEQSIYPIYFGTPRGFVYKGNGHGLMQLINGNKNPTVLEISDEPNLTIVNDLFDYRNLISLKSHSRSFNELQQVGKKYRKKSTRKQKIIDEFNFLNTVPSKFRQYFVEVFDLKLTRNTASYEMEKSDDIDLSIRYINNSISNNEMDIVFKILTSYFRESIANGFISNGDEVRFIMDKNRTRYDLLRNWKGYVSLDGFITNYTEFGGFQDLVQISNKLISSKESIIRKSSSIFSHGDLCFSNILYSSELQTIKLIDPRGETNFDSYLSPYYDLAKLSHSFLGKYDFIVNDRCSIQFSDDMKAYLDFDSKDDYSNEIRFSKFIIDLGFDPNIVKIVEISLFLSMLPLHTGNVRKLYMLALRSVELISKLERDHEL